MIQIVHQLPKDCSKNIKNHSPQFSLFKFRTHLNSFLSSVTGTQTKERSSIMPPWDDSQDRRNPKEIDKPERISYNQSKGP